MKLPQLYDIFREEWEKYQSVWLISDTHFDDEELYIGTKHVIRANSENYVKLINSKVGKNDLLICLGDVGNIEPIAKIRAAHKILVMGNHDVGASNYKRQKWEEIFDGMKFSKEQILEIMKKKYPNCHITISDKEYRLAGPPFECYIAIADNKLFDRVFQGPVMIGEKLILSHEPLGLDWAFNIHGHMHSFSAENEKNCFNICPDATGHFEPIPLKQILEGGYMSSVKTVHRGVIDNATKRARKRGYSYGKKVKS